MEQEAAAFHAALPRLRAVPGAWRQRQIDAVLATIETVLGEQAGTVAA
jgi:hypothetical protein